jgi:hypothetical protein
MNGRATGETGITNGMVKNSGIAIMQWLVRLLNLCMNMGITLEDWRSAIIVTSFNGMGDKKEYKNYIGISLHNTPGKVYGGVLIERVDEITELQMRDEQGGCRKVRDCANQVFALKCMCEKYLEKQKEVFDVLMYLQKAYDRVDRMTMWEVFRMYEVGGDVLGAILYEKT